MVQFSCIPLSLPRVAKKVSWWLVVFFWFLMLAPAQAALLLRVAIIQGVNQVKIGTSTAAVVRDASGRTLGQIPAMSSYYAEPRGGTVALDRWQTGQIWIEPSNGGYAYIGDRWYRGRIHIVPVSGNLTAVNIVDLEQYLYSVIGAEMSPSWPQEALKAQAVAARSYALYQRDRYGNSIYDVGDTQAWQVYKGLESETNTTQAAVEATKGQVLTYNGKIIEAVFHSSSGGHTENVEDVWSEPRPYLRGVPDYDAGAPVYEWSSSISRAQLSNLMGVGNISAIKPERTSSTGRVISVRAYGSDGERLFSGEQLQSLLNLRSTLFTINPNGNTFTIYGRGFGHGVGMSQWGAYNLASRGYNYQQILGHYYRNSALAQIKIN